ncbi:MAG: tetratricopeptide repeat protein [Acidobacteriota bacterium]
MSEQLLERKVELAEEQAAIPALRMEFARHPVDRQLVLIRNSRRFQTWSLCESLLADCQAQRPRDPQCAVDLARLALAIASVLDVEYYGESLVQDMKARCSGELAACFCIQERYPEAEKAFAVARSLLALGTGDPIEKAHLQWLEASLRVSQRRFAEAEDLLDRVIRTARRNGESHLLGKALISKGMCSEASGQEEAEIRWIREGVELIDPALEPRLVLVVRHNLILSLVNANRFDEALETLDEARALHHKLGNRVDLIRFGWIEGRVYQGLGRFDEAEELLREAQSKFLDLSRDYDAALVSLDLATLYGSQKRWAEIKVLAQAMLPIFRSKQIHREAIAALLVFRDAVEREQVTLGLVREAVQRIKGAPSLPETAARDETEPPLSGN